MLLAIDIGNSATKFGLFNDETLTSKFSIPTKRDTTPDEIKLAVGTRLHSSIDSAIACSVVPEMEPAVTSFLRDATGVDPIFVNNSFDFGLKINYTPLDSLGTDRLVAAFAAVEKYGAPVIVCSLGTATTIDVVSADRQFLGGVIAPGMDAMAEALHMKAPRLPNVEIREPESLIGNSTVESIQSGVYYGYAAMVDGLIAKFKAGAAAARVVATGGNATEITLRAKAEVIIDPNLILEGLRLLYRSVPPA